MESSLGSLQERDRRLAHEIAAGVLRTRTELDSRLKPLVSAEWRRVAPDLKDVLRIGAYQLLNLDRVPAHAAVETAVDLARARIGTGAAGLANAVLRKLAAGDLTSDPGSRFDVTPNPSPSGRGEQTATGLSHPEWMVKRWQSRFGVERTQALLEHNNRRPPLVIQAGRWTLERLAGALSEAGIAFEPVSGSAGCAVRGARVTELPGFSEGGFIVQDPAQARVLEFAAIPDGDLLWDACASPGGKAAVLAQGHRVMASDIRRERLERLRDTASRVAPALPIFAADARQAPIRAGSMDAVLLDAPCSATGTLARHPDARWRLTPRRMETLARLQTEILKGVARVARPGGLLVYATCSLEPEENENQVNAFLEKHPEYRRTRDDLFVFPPDSRTDGAYAARLERGA